jgi:hypothetical protein
MMIFDLRRPGRLRPASDQSQSGEGELRPRVAAVPEWEGELRPRVAAVPEWEGELRPRVAAVPEWGGGIAAPSGRSPKLWPQSQSGEGELRPRVAAVPEWKGGIVAPCDRLRSPAAVQNNELPGIAAGRKELRKLALARGVVRRRGQEVLQLGAKGVGVGETVFSRQQSTIRSRAFGTPAGGCGVRCRIWSSRSPSSPSMKGRRPARRRYSRTPQDHRSLRGSAGCPSRRSGLRKDGVPAAASSPGGSATPRGQASPRSDSSRWPPREISTLPGLTSRWTQPRSCRQDSARARKTPDQAAIRGGTGPAAARHPRSAPSMY